MADLAVFTTFPGSALESGWNVEGGATIVVASGDCKITDQAGGISWGTLVDFTGKRLQIHIKDGSQPDGLWFSIANASHVYPMAQWLSGVWSAGQSAFASPGYRANYGNMMTSSNAGRPFFAMEHDAGAGNILYYDAPDVGGGVPGTFDLFHTASLPRDYSAVRVAAILDTNGGAAVDFYLSDIGVAPAGGGAVPLRPYMLAG